MEENKLLEMETHFKQLTQINLNTINDEIDYIENEIKNLNTENNLIDYNTTTTNLEEKNKIYTDLNKKYNKKLEKYKSENEIKKRNKRKDLVKYYTIIKNTYQVITEIDNRHQFDIYSLDNKICDLEKNVKRDIDYKDNLNNLNLNLKELKEEILLLETQVEKIKNYNTSIEKHNNKLNDLKLKKKKAELLLNLLE